MAEIDKKNIELPKESQIKKSGFNNFMSRLFGWSRSKNQSIGNSPIEFSKVDVQSNERIGQALLNQLQNTQGPMSEELEKLFQFWLSDNTDKISELQKRKQRVDQLQYMYLNDPYVNRTVALYADEATQLDQQNTVINIETPDPQMTKEMYALLNSWGLNQNRIRATIEQLAIYGDAFWSNKVTERGVERIKPLQQLQITDRIEFNPVKVMESEKRKSGAFNNFASSNYLINQMLKTMEDTGDVADMFDTKLFGFSIDDDLIVPPWLVTHFRVNADGSEFYPWGTSPILGALAPYKQTQSTITLQSLARLMSFPIQVYKVKTSDAMDEGRQFGVVNRVREAYDNIGVSPTAGTSEVYTVNTKIWIPDNLLNLEVHKSEIDTSNTDDIALYQSREAVALGIPRSFFGEEGWYSGIGNSGKSLTQQYKPFARKVFSIQSAFLEGLADLFRIHFAITGDYDFRVPFTISMKYPAVEDDDSYDATRQTSIDVATSVIDLVKGAIGAEEDEGLPPDIVRDIIAKYTFLDPVDIMKWTRDAKFSTDINSEGGSDGGEGGDDLGTDVGDDTGMEGGDDILGGGDEGGDTDLGGDDSGDSLDIAIENVRRSLETRLRELENRKLSPRKRLRERELSERYLEKRGEIYFNALKENGLNSFTRYSEHVQVFNQIDSVSELMLETLSRNNSKSLHLHEELSDLD